LKLGDLTDGVPGIPNLKGETAGIGATRFVAATLPTPAALQ